MLKYSEVKHHVYNKFQMIYLTKSGGGTKANRTEC